MASRIWETGSVPGVRIAANINIVIMECLLYFLIIPGFNIPIFERKKESIGSSKTNPAPRITLNIIEKYSSIEKLFSIVGDPNCAANFRVNGSITKYANTTPTKKHTVVKVTIAETYFFSFSFNAGEINFQSW